MLGFTTALLIVLSAAQPYAATVNGKPITEPEVAKAIRDHLRKTSFHREPSEEQLAAERPKAVDALVAQELRAQEARRRGLTAERAAIEKLAAAEEASAGGKAKFEALLASFGIDRVRYLEVIERPELSKRLEEAEVQARLVEPTHDEALAHYRANPKRYVVGASVHAQELCVRVEPWAPEDGWKKGEQQAAELRAQLAKGGDFARAAREAKCDPFAEKGGDLGFVHQGSIDPAMDQALWALEDGQVSAPVRTIRGWHLIRRLETRPERPVPFPEVEKAIVAELRKARREAIVKRLDAELRARGKVVVAGRS
jgi:parvulin-like peptidyl-prolyl isomerase